MATLEESVLEDSYWRLLLLMQQQVLVLPAASPLLPLRLKQCRGFANFSLL